VRLNDAVIGVVLVAFALLVGTEATGFPQLPGQRYGAALFPLIIACGLGVCGLALIASGLRQRATSPWLSLTPAAQNLGRWFNVGLMLVALVFYVVASEPLGFIPTAFLITATLLIRLRGRWPTSLVIAAVTTMLVHQVFSAWLLVPLPWGVLEPIVF